MKKKKIKLMNEIQFNVICLFQSLRTYHFSPNLFSFPFFKSHHFILRLEVTCPKSHTPCSSLRSLLSSHYFHSTVGFLRWNIFHSTKMEKHLFLVGKVCFKNKWHSGIAFTSVPYDIIAGPTVGRICKHFANTEKWLCLKSQMSFWTKLN